MDFQLSMVWVSGSLLSFLDFQLLVRFSFILLPCNLHPDYLSATSIAFHMLKRPEQLKRYEFLLYLDSRRVCEDYGQQHDELSRKR